MKSDLSPNNYKLWIVIAIIMKGLFFWLRVAVNYEANQPLFGFFIHDSSEYYDSVNHFYETGIYTPDVRTPGLGIIFLILRTILERDTVLNTILILQWLTTSVAIYVLSLIISRTVKKESVFYFVFFLIPLTHYVFTWDVLFLTESFCISSFIFSLYYLQKSFNEPAGKPVFLAGTFFTWCVFLRPVFFIFYGIAGLFLLYFLIRRKTEMKTICRYILLFSVVFIFLDSVWVIRNYQVKHKFTFLNDIDGYSELSQSDPMPAVYLFLEAWGGDLENERHGFEVNKTMDYKYRDTLLPDYIYTSQFNKDSLFTVKQRMRYYHVHPSDSIVALINNSMERFTNSIRKEKPFLYYVGAGLINYKKMLMSGYFNYDQFNEDFSKLPLTTRVYRISRALLFYLLFFIGAVYSIVYLFSGNKNRLMKMLICIAHVNLFYIAFFFRTAEFRYVLPTTLIFMCLTAIVFDKLLGRRTTFVKQ